MKSKKKAKRIVSKVDYTKVQARRAGDSILAVFLILIGFFFLLVTIAGLVLFSLHGLMGACMFAPCAYMFLKAGFATKKTVESETVDIVPLTRANSQELPALDILVRATEKPLQDHEAILLRAATGTQETPADELLRPIETTTDNMK